MDSGFSGLPASWSYARHVTWELALWAFRLQARTLAQTDDATDETAIRMLRDRCPKRGVRR